jgi:hypothetical protein
MRRHIDLVRGLRRRLPGACGLAAAAAAAGDPGPLLELDAFDAFDAFDATRTRQPRRSAVAARTLWHGEARRWACER